MEGGVGVCLSLDDPHTTAVSLSSGQRPSTEDTKGLKRDILIIPLVSEADSSEMDGGLEVWFTLRSDTRGEEEGLAKEVGEETLQDDEEVVIGGVKYNLKEAAGWSSFWR